MGLRSRLKDSAYNAATRVLEKTNDLMDKALNRCEICCDFDEEKLFRDWPLQEWRDGDYEDLQDHAAAGCETCGIILEGCQKVNRVDYAGRNDPWFKIWCDGKHIRCGFGDSGDGRNELIDQENAGTVFYTPVGTKSPWAAMKERRTPMVNPTPADCAAFLNPLIRECFTGHSTCGNRFKQHMITGFVPKRLLYIGPLVSWDAPLLYEPHRYTHKPYGPGGPYIALSHCWGKTQIITTKTDNFEQHLKAVSWTALSKTFRDAIQISRALGIYYIWIDSLCIIQDSKEDWVQESTQMAGIYMNAYLTIGASSAEAGDQGLFLQRPRPHSIYRTDASGKPFEIIAQEAQGHELDHQPDMSHFTEQRGTYDSGLRLRTRSWCLQEELLSVRFVHFTRGEIVWVCLECTTCECNTQPRLSIWANEFNVYKATRESWMGLVQNFTQRDITYDSDGLPALSALSRTIVNRGQYLAGLWSEDLPACLLWRTDGVTKGRAQHQNPDSCPPSWSWASRGTCRIEFDPCHLNTDDDEEQWSKYGGHRPEVHILEAETWPSTADPHRLCIGGRIVLRGQVYPLESGWVRDYQGLSTPHSRSNFKIKLKIPYDCGAWNQSCYIELDHPRPFEIGFDGEFEDAIFRVEYPVYFLVLTSTMTSTSITRSNYDIWRKNIFHGLLLKDADQLSYGSEGKHYKRIGYGEINFDWQWRPVDRAMELVILE